MKDNHILLMICGIMISLSVNAQKADSTAVSPFKVTADLVSHYVWRGSMATGSPTPNFQPTIAYTKGNVGIYRFCGKLQGS